MSLEKLGSAGTEYGCEARELTDADLYTEDAYGASFAQEDLAEDAVDIIRCLW